MIPYLDITTFRLGPLTIHTWGFVVSLGFAVAILVAYRRARRTGLDGGKVLDLAFWILVAAFVGARLFHVFFYEWPYYRMYLNEIVRVDQGGLSSFGGFIGAVAAFWVYGRLKIWEGRASGDPEARPRAIWRYADLLMFAFPLGWAIGRIGCFLTHMHPGRLSNMPWAVQYPDGGRLDMGLIESAALISYWAALVIFDRRRLSPLGLRPPSPVGRGEGKGHYLMSGMIFYGVTRFILDFFRTTDLPVSDARYFGLTPAQYGSVALLIGGIYLYASRRTVRPSSPDVV